MKFLSLFAGIGGFDLGLERAGMECIGQVEINPFCQRVLAHHWPEIKRIGDIRNVNGKEFGECDLICGGVPCQPASTAGKRRGTEDDRWLWPEAFRIVRNVHPTWCLFENVRGITSLENGVVFESLLSDLESYGYEVQPFSIPACAVDARHKRERIWIVAHTKGERVFGVERNVYKKERGSEFALLQRSNSTSSNVPDTNGSGFGERRRSKSIQSEQCAVECTGEDVADTSRELFDWDGEARGRWRQSSDCCRWLPEPGLGRVAHGVPGRVDRLRSLGNAVVPQIVEVIGRAIMQSQNQDARSNTMETGEHLTTKKV